MYDVIELICWRMAGRKGHKKSNKKQGTSYITVKKTEVFLFFFFFYLFIFLFIYFFFFFFFFAKRAHSNRLVVFLLLLLF